MFFRKKNNPETIYKNAYRAFFVLCMRYCNTKEDAEEVFNDGLVKYFAYEQKNKVKESTRYALIKKILINTCIDYTRKRRVLFENIDDKVVIKETDTNDIEYLQLKDELLFLVQNLPPKTRLIFNLYIFEGWSHGQIAKHLEITENTSFWHLHQGKKKVLALFNKVPVQKS